MISDSCLALVLEYWFPFDEIPLTRSLGIWCDGIPLVTVSDLSRNVFALAGVGYFPYDLSPFELDFHYENRRDLLTVKIALRFGIDDGGSLRTFRSSVSPEKVLSHRPREIRGWAVAVEFTPQ